jgi:hypothetical protein
LRHGKESDVGRDNWLLVGLNLWEMCNEKFLPWVVWIVNYHEMFSLIKKDVGDSPRGPLKQTGESPLKTHDKPKLSAPHLNTRGRAHAAVAPTAHQDGPLKDPLEQALPRSRAHASPERAPPGSRGCAYLKQAPPRSRVCSALKRATPRSRAPRTRTPVPVRGH